MSRSFRKKPIIGIAGASSEKSYKKNRQHRIRQITREQILNGNYDAAMFEQLPYDDWSADKDGKQYLDLDYLEEKYGKRYVYQLIGK